VEGGVVELGDVILSVIVKVNAPTAVGSSALLGGVRGSWKCPIVGTAPAAVSLNDLKRNKCSVKLCYETRVSIGQNPPTLVPAVVTDQIALLIPRPSALTGPNDERDLPIGKLKVCVCVTANLGNEKAAIRWERQYECSASCKKD
jgi:hypothetical protein